MKDIYNSLDGKWRSLRCAILIPLSMMVAAVVWSCCSYSSAKRGITDELNEAMVAYANKNSELWTHQDTIAAMRRMHQTTHGPLIYQASDIKFSSAVLRDNAFLTIALVDKKNAASRNPGHKFVSDSIILVPENTVDGIAVHLQGFADCSMAALFSASDQTFPGILFLVSIISMTAMLLMRRSNSELSKSGEVLPGAVTPSVEGLKLTSMQRQLLQMLIDAPGYKVDKPTLCKALWGNKSNAEESLYTLVRRTKAALADTPIEIVCNRGQSYGLRVKI